MKYTVHIYLETSLVTSVKPDGSMALTTVIRQFLICTGLDNLLQFWGSERE